MTIPTHGTGFLVPRTEGRFITACTWMSSKWPQLHVPGEVLMRASAGRFGDGAMVVDDNMTDDDMARHALEDLKHMGVVHGAPLETVVTRWPLSFPQYDVGHLDRVAAIERGRGPLPGLAVAGAALHGVGIPACIGSGRRAAMVARARQGPARAHDVDEGAPRQGRRAVAGGGSGPGTVPAAVGTVGGGLSGRRRCCGGGPVGCGGGDGCWRGSAPVSGCSPRACGGRCRSAATAERS